ncbi:MAG TPA: hypothetical protein DD735_01180 [Clostridiales bacterium]|jgi:hypothetical protein|nr:hypothetical protein [Clostridiales bacterium]
MKFVKEPDKSGIVIPAPAIKLSELDGLPLEIHTLPGAVVVISAEMEAMELIRTAESLKELFAELLTHLAKVCGPCNHCDGTKAECPLINSFGTPDVLVPGWALDEAGIPRDAKLTCDADEESGEIRVCAADYEHDLTDVPRHLVESFRSFGFCLGELEEHLMVEDIVYGG